jgi:hypothetical protein
MGLYSFCFIGLSPFGALLLGFAAHHVGVSTTLFSGAAVGGIVALVLTRSFFRSA